MRRRVVVTGVGLVTPLGGDVDSNWEALLAGRSGLAPVTRFDTSTLPCRIAAEVRDLHPGSWVSPLDERRVDRFIVFALAAAEEAVRGARLVVSDALAERVGVVLGVGLGGLPGIEAAHQALADAGPRRLSPFFIPAVIANLA